MFQVPHSGFVFVVRVLRTVNTNLEPGTWNLEPRSAPVLSLITMSLAVTLAASPASQRGSASPAVPVLSYDVVASYPHDPEAFTQGLIYRDGFLFESTGLNGRSSLRKVRLETGEVVQNRRVDTRYFAEGLTDWGNRLIQLTYTTNVAFVYNLASFATENTFTYGGQGWGLTHDDRRLIMSDGTATLRFLEPVTYAEIGRVSVTADGRPVDRLNELELVEGQVFANVWLTNRIAIIQPASGRVTGWIDLAGLLPAGAAGHDVLNGIAYDGARDRLFVTGKLWPRLFEIKVRPQR
jgi:glutamine cyclotransferase